MSSNLLRTLQRICPLHLPPLPRRRRSIFSSNKSQSTHPKPTCTLCLHASYLIRAIPTCPYVCMLPILKDPHKPLVLMFCMHPILKPHLSCFFYGCMLPILRFITQIVLMVACLLSYIRSHPTCPYVLHASYLIRSNSTCLVLMFASYLPYKA